MQHLTLFQAIVLALLQGVTELFPISSLGHTVILPSLLGWGNLQTDTSCAGQSCFLPFITGSAPGYQRCIVNLLLA